MGHRHVFKSVNDAVHLQRGAGHLHVLLQVSALIWCIAWQEFHTKYLAATAAVVLIIGPFFAGHLRPVRFHVNLFADVSPTCSDKSVDGIRWPKAIRFRNEGSKQMRLL